MTTYDSTDTSKYNRILIKYARMSAYAVAVLLLVWAVNKLLAVDAALYPWVNYLSFFYTMLYAIWMVFPWIKLKSAKQWKVGMIGFLILSFVFVFLLIANIMIDSSVAASEGRRLGVPGLEGTIIFLCLGQIPAILFERYPHLME